jgi:hypothetical protein
MTAYSFIDLVQYLFKIPGIKSFLSEKLCQDPLEKYFGEQRQKGRTNENPTASQFLKNQQSLRVVNSIKINTSKGNTRGHKRLNHVPLDDEPLPKRKRSSHKSKCESHIDKFVSQSTELEDAIQQAVTVLQMPTETASCLLEMAKLLHSWCTLAHNKHILRVHNEYLINFFKIWISSSSTQGITQFIREEVWTRFASFISSAEYAYFWTSFYTLAGIITTPYSPFK